MLIIHLVRFSFVFSPRDAWKAAPITPALYTTPRAAVLRIFSNIFIGARNHLRLRDLPSEKSYSQCFLHNAVAEDATPMKCVGGRSVPRRFSIASYATC